MIFAMVPAIFIKSKSTLNEDYAPFNIKNIGSSFKGIIDGFIEAFKNRPFRKLCIATFLVFNAFNTVAAFTFFIVVYYLFNGDAPAAGIWPTLFGSLGALSTTFLVIPIVTRMSKVMGKKRAFLASQSISIIGYILLWFLFIPGKPYMFIFALPFFAFGIGSLFTLMMSMTADVIDLDELNSGLRREGVFGAIYWWMVKFGFAIAGLLSGLILSIIGFDADAAVQTEGAITGLRLFFSGLPILGTLIAILVMRGYDLTEERAIEISAELYTRKNGATEALSAKYKSGKLLSFVSDGLDVDSKSNIDFTTKSKADIKKLYAKSLKNGLHGLCFSPYSEGQDIGDILTEEQISKRMDVITPYTKWVRSFSCTDGNEFIPKAAREKGLKTMVGAWISDDKAQNEKEINALINLANQGHVDVAVVGNEVLLRNELTVHEIIDYIKQVKEALPNIPVGYVDAYYQFSEHPELVEVCDVILANCYPFWEGCHIDQASNYLKQMYNVVENASQGKPVIITETGWPSEGDKTNDAEASQENALKYFINVNNWANKEGVKLYYFSSFDESWKIHHEGDVGQRWGIWDKNEKLKNI